MIVARPEHYDVAESFATLGADDQDNLAYILARREQHAEERGYARGLLHAALGRTALSPDYSKDDLLRLEREIAQGDPGAQVFVIAAVKVAKPDES